jgi:hypothetical protein
VRIAFGERQTSLIDALRRRGGSRPTSNTAPGGRLRLPSRASGESMADLVSARTRTRFRDLATSSTLGRISSAFQDEEPGLMSVAET